MNKEQAQAVLDAANTAAEAVVRARGDRLTAEEAEALFDRAFFGLLVDLIGGMTQDELFDLVDPER